MTRLRVLLATLSAPAARRRTRLAARVAPTAKLRIPLATLLALAVTALAAALPSAAPAAEGGVNLGAVGPSTEAQAVSLGAHWMRVFLPWKFIEPEQGVHASNWIWPYQQLLTTVPKGTKVILDVVSAPSWASGSSAGNAPPSDPATYASFIHYIAGLWGNRVAAYEIWNEENTSQWWANPEAAAYTRLLQSAYTAVKSAEPNATVVLGGLAGNDYSFLQDIYQAGGKGYFDAVGVHTDTACNVNSPYTFLRNPDGRLEPDSFLGYREIHATELANGDDKPIWMTEMSWRTTSALCAEGAFAGQKPQGVSEEQQAEYLQQGYHCLAEDPYVQVALWYPIADEGNVTSGLLRSNLTPKPAYAAMHNFLANGDQLTGTCGDFAGPKITLVTPTEDQRYTGRLKIKAIASDPAGIRHISLYWDGHLVRNWVPYLFTHTYPQSTVAEMHWFGAMKLPPGRYQLTILAKDRLENVSTTHLTIVHLPEHRGHHGHHGQRHHSQDCPTFPERRQPPPPRLAPPGRLKCHASPP